VELAEERRLFIQFFQELGGFEIERRLPRLKVPEIPEFFRYD
jgi:hypothetical protein